jgi:hypothetical protein
MNGAENYSAPFFIFGFGVPRLRGFSEPPEGGTPNGTGCLFSGLDSLCPCGSGKIFTSAAAVNNPEWRGGGRWLNLTTQL